MSGLAEALIAAGVATPPNGTTTTTATNKKRKRNRRMGHWGTSGLPNMIQWSHPDLGNVQIELKYHKFSGEVNQRGANTWQRVELGGNKPARIVLETLYDLQDGVELVYGLGKKLLNSADQEIPKFVVNVKWMGGVPHLNHGDTEDYQLYLVNKTTGFFVHLDVTVISRKGGFWVTVQEVLGAQAIWHPAKDGNGEQVTMTGFTSVEFGNLAYTLVPVYSENCYPGFDPVASIERSYPGRTKPLLDLIAKWDAAVSWEDAEQGEWAPEWPTRMPADLDEAGYVPAVVLWYNLTIGFGFVQLEDGRQCMAHFKSFEDWSGKKIADGEDFPIIEAGKGCYVKWQQDPGKSNPRAVALRTA